MYSTYIWGNGTKGKHQILFTVSAVNGNSKLPFVCCKWKPKMELCFLGLANDKQLSTISISVNVPIYGYDTAIIPLIACGLCLLTGQQNRC